MDPLDRDILEIIGRYRLVTRRALGQLVLEGPAVDSVVARLLRANLVWAGHSLSRGKAFYQLTPKAAAVVGVPESRARPLKPQALFKHLGIFCFCHVSGSRRFRMEDDELRGYIGDVCPDAAHCMGMFRDRPIVLSTYVPGQRTNLKSITRWLRQQLDAVREIAPVRQLLQDQLYGFAIVTETEQRRKAILSMLHKPDRHGPALTRRARIIVEAVPEFDEHINGVRKSEPRRHPRTRADADAEPSLFTENKQSDVAGESVPA